MREDNPTDRLHLGRKGEEAVEDLLVAHELESDFGIGFLVDDRDDRDFSTGALFTEIRSPLWQQTDELIQLEPDETFADEFERGGSELAERSHECRPVVWIEARDAKATDWRSALATMNTNRSWMQEIPALFVVAGGPQLEEIAGFKTPDIWTVRSFEHYFEEPLTAMNAPDTLRWLHFSDLHLRGNERWKRRATLEAFVDKIEKLIDEGLGPDLTGARDRPPRRTDDRPVRLHPPRADGTPRRRRMGTRRLERRR